MTAIRPRSESPNSANCGICVRTDDIIDAFKNEPETKKKLLLLLENKNKNYFVKRISIIKITDNIIEEKKTF